jgi:hypothetical protein
LLLRFDCRLFALRLEQQAELRIAPAERNGELERRVIVADVRGELRTFTHGEVAPRRYQQGEHAERVRLALRIEVQRVAE